MNIGTLEWASREASGRNASGFTCPECGGALWDAEDGRYVCRIGHGFAPESLLDGQAAAVENHCRAPPALSRSKPRWRVVSRAA
jgi:hypothetical protein